MAEIQQTTNSADLTQRFVLFVRMQMQNILLCLGLLEHPEAGQTEPDLEAAKMFIDQLEMIGEKTRGNLTPEEEKFLTGVLTELRMAFVQVASGSASAHVHDDNCGHDHGDHSPAAEAIPEPSSPTAEVHGDSSEKKPSEEEGKKKFTKSYGA
jgi:Domain of unknown function (DUF1844)